jgi:hypothetical protein
MYRLILAMFVGALLTAGAWAIGLAQTVPVPMSTPIPAPTPAPMATPYSPPSSLPPTGPLAPPPIP